MQGEHSCGSTVLISQQEYNHLRQRILALEQQNRQLKQKIQQNQDQIPQLPEDITQSLNQPKTTFVKKGKSSHLRHLIKENSSSQMSPQQLKQSWVQWSRTIEENKRFRDLVFKPHNQSDTSGEESSNQNFDLDDPLKLIEGICLYGPNQEQILKSQNRAFSVSSKLYYPQEQRFEHYAPYFSSEQIPVKKIREQKQATETNRIIFKKNPTKNDTAVFMFQAQEKHHVNGKSRHNQLLNLANPGKRLYVFSIPFYDFLTYKKQNGQNSSEDGCQSQRNLQAHQMPDRRMLKKLSLVGQAYDMKCNKEGQWNFFASKFCLCIFSYFPLVNLYEKVLLRAMDMIKIKRMQIFTEKPGQLNLIDFRFVRQQMEQITGEMINSINSLAPQIDNTKYVNLGHENYLIDLSQENLNNEIYQNWTSQCLKHFNKDTLYEVMCYMLMEESLCFVSEDLHVLTYMMLLFSDLLLRPLSNPHPIISVAFKQQLLGTPFIVNMGIHKSTKWLEQNSDLFADNKVIVNLNQELMIKSRKKPKLVKSNKLKQLVSSLYKKKQLSDSIPNFFRRKESLSRTSSEQENQNAIVFAIALREFFEEEIIAHLPSKQIIKEIKHQARRLKKQQHAKKKNDENANPKNTISQSQINKQYLNMASVSKKALEYVQTYFNESRKIREKDLLIESLSQQQLFYVYLCDTYGLK